MERALAWLDVPIRVLLWASIVAGLAMMIHVTIDVAGRTLFNSPLPGTTEIVSAYYMVAVAYLPWAWIARNNQHIVAEMFTNIGPRAFHIWLGVVVKIATLVYTAVFAWETYLRAVQQTNLGEVWQAAAQYIPVWPSRWLLPIAGGMMTLYLVLRIIRDVAREFKS
jgi:TRAP-type C4-dicarboxylate transport system permease small subunit